MTINDFFYLIKATEDEKANAYAHVRMMSQGEADPLKLALYLLAVRINKLEDRSKEAS